MGRLRALIFRHRARAGIRFLRWMDRLMFVQGYNHRQKKQAWRDFTKSPHSRRAVLDQLAVGCGLRIRRERHSREERRFETLLHKYLHLQSAARDLYLKACWTTASLPPDIQAAMWERLRDALDLAKGTATAKGVAPPALPTIKPTDASQEGPGEVHPA